MVLNINIDSSQNKPPISAFSVNKTEAELRNEGYSSDELRSLKKTGRLECQTCANRKYVDGSNDSGVSFQTPQKIPAGKTAAIVTSHEREHVSRNAVKAERTGREIVSSSVRLFSSVCPECGRTYISGGETRTITKKKQVQQVFADEFFNISLGGKLPKTFDMIS